jgi:nucleoid-associated protein YgaU
MGKEVKIGLVVILSLTIVLGAVVALRVMGPSQTAEATSDDQQKPPTTANAKPAQQKVPPPKRVETPKPTVVAAKPVAPRLPKNPAGQWTVATDANDKSQQPATAAAPLPSYMPKPMSPASLPYHQQYGSNAQQAIEPAPDPAQVTDPFQQHASPMPSAGGPVDAGNSALKILNPPPAPPVPTQDGIHDYGQSQPNPYRSPAVQRAPVAQQAPRYPQQQRPITPVGQYGGSSSSRVSVYGAGQYTGEDPRSEDGSYKVRPNDSYWTISERVYGSGSYFKALAEHNRGKVPQENALAVGQRIAAPDVSELEELYPALCPKPSRRETVKSRANMVSTRMPYGGGRTYIVEEGDTLFDIARYELGKASRWVEIYELNRDLLGDDHDYLTAGLRLTLPSDQPAARITTRPDVRGDFNLRR